MYGSSYFGLLLANLAGFKPPKIVKNSSQFVMKIGSKAGPFKVSPAKPNVVTPTCCDTKVKSFSEVKTPGDTNIFCEAI